MISGFNFLLKDNSIFFSFNGYENFPYWRFFAQSFRYLAKFWTFLAKFWTLLEHEAAQAQNSALHATSFANICKIWTKSKTAQNAFCAKAKNCAKIYILQNDQILVLKQNFNKKMESFIYEFKYKLKYIFLFISFIH